ncbi:MAG: uvrD [Candidatus Saccharibacteria bacterium]|nr:uvrD [Candidatus Saccharibacteria bacterium]
MDFTERYSHLNLAQKQAVDLIDGPVMVIAGPGTGKTELLSMRAANILKKTDVLPENILCLTFTDSGANAMRERLTHIIGVNAYKVAIHTFHSFGTDVINHNGEFFYHGANFRAADQLSCYQLLRGIFDELEYSNPLASKMNGEYTHLSDTLTTISELKKSGLTSDELLAVLDANDHVIEVAEPLLAQVFAARLSKTTADQLAPLVEIIQRTNEEIELPGITSLARVLAGSLESTIAVAQETNSTKPLTSWRNTWFKKDETGEFVLKSRDRQKKLRATSFVYYQYLARMQEAELYDFDDMILRVVHAMEVFPELRFNLQEKYQYIMVDEFQDTNMAQMRILYDLTNNEINNGRPNILVVGDDDQAIYSFQGADVGNISAFRDLFNETVLITLTDNYRSSDTILSHARSVIKLGSDRLENHVPDLNKTLTAHFTPSETSVELVELPSVSDERSWLLNSIESALKGGQSAASIAVLARRHHEIMALLPYFASAGIPVNYERRDNVLDLDIIVLIEHASSILVALFEQRHKDADSLLPKLLSHPAFAIPPLDIWQLGLQAQQNHQLWMEIMATTPALKPLQNWLITTSQLLAHSHLEQMLDEIIGVPKHQTLASNPSLKLEQGTLHDESSPLEFVSPLYEHYFSAQQLKEAPDAYLTYLEALRTIRTKLVDYKPLETPTLQSFLEFIKLHRQLGSTITSVRPRTHHIDNAVNLMTAHKSKGLEFDTVYVIGAVDSAWGERVRTRNRLISYPENLPLAPSGDTFDERLRLFFVAMTRARMHLKISYSGADDKQKNTLPASFLIGETWQATQPQLPSSIESLTHSAELVWYQPIVTPLTPSMRELLAPALENYKLSSTHLNAFLDVSRGGPQAFLMNNLLRFPQATSPSAGYGSAIHTTLQRAHSHLTATGKHRPIEDILHDFEENLHSQHLTDRDFDIYLQKGSEALSRFLEVKYSEFSPSQKTELNFAGQAVFFEEAHLTGSLDLVDIQDQTITVTDYKTGKAIRNWTGKTDYEKMKLHRYKQQLMFYCLLIHHSRDYNKFTVEKSVIQFVEPTLNGDIISLEAQFSHEELARFRQLIHSVWRRIIMLDLPDTSAYEPSYKGVLEFEDDLIADTVPSTID